MLWLWIIWHLKDTLDQYRDTGSDEDLSGNFKKEDIVDGVTFSVDREEKDER